jgi:ABC-type transporter Mla subunit MlaD
MTQLDGSKFEILRALDNVNELSKSISANTETLDLALAELPSAIESVDSQRDDLVKMLRALADLSGIGVRVIKASKQGTIDSLNALAPILSNIDKAGDTFPRSLQVFLTYPFIDAVVGKTAQAARDLHMGDYTNLSVNLQVKPDAILEAAGQEGPQGCVRIGDVCFDPNDLSKPGKLVNDIVDGVTGGGGGGGGGDDGGGILNPPGGSGDGSVVPNLPGANRAAPGAVDVSEQRVASGVDGELAGLLAWGVLPR